MNTFSHIIKFVLSLVCLIIFHENHSHFLLKVNFLIPFPKKLLATDWKNPKYGPKHFYSTLSLHFFKPNLSSLDVTMTLLSKCIANFPHVSYVPSASRILSLVLLFVLIDVPFQDGRHAAWAMIVWNRRITIFRCVFLNIELECLPNSWLMSYTNVLTMWNNSLASSALVLGNVCAGTYVIKRWSKLCFSVCRVR